MTGYVGEIRPVGFSYAPPDWLPCNGALYNINGFEVLFALLGTTYGGDGISTFAVPDLRGRAPAHQGTGLGLSTYVLGQTFGAETVTLTTAQIPAHTHAMLASTAPATSGSPVGGYPAVLPHDAAYASTGAALTMGATSASGGGQSHPNRPPSLAINFIICAAGLYPTQS